MTHSFIDLFAGAGGLSLGFVRAGFRPILAVESNAACAGTYSANLGPHVVRHDIRGVVRELKRSRAAMRADIVVGGPPCQGFSNLTGNRPDDERRALYREFLDIVEASDCRVFVLENVPNLLSSPEADAIVRKAERLGYTIAESGIGVLLASEFGVPQNRRRAFIIGTRLPRKAGVIGLPAAKGRVRTVADAFRGIPARPHHDDLYWHPARGSQLHFSRNPTELSRRRYRHIPPGGNRFDLPSALRPPCWRRKDSGGTDLFGRLEWTAPARCTIRTEFFKPEKGRYLHPSADRPITHWEAARLQTFPDTFRFHGTKLEIASQIGNAVPPLLAYAIGAHIASRLTALGVPPFARSGIRFADAY